MDSCSDLYDQLVGFVAAIDTLEQQQQDPELHTTGVDDAFNDHNKQENLENLRAAYRTLQELAKEIKPAIDAFFDRFIDDTEPPLDDEASFRAMNSKLNIFLAFCPGIRMAYQMESDDKRAEQPAVGGI